APVIIAPHWNLDFELMCDASDYAVGAVLGQRIDKKFCPIYYASKTMNDAQEHYTTTEKELLAVNLPLRLKTKKGTENLAVDHLSRLENPDLKILNEEAIRDSFPDEYLMAVHVREIAEDPWYADYVNFLVSNIIPHRFVFGKEMQEILEHCHTGPTGGHYEADITARKIFESGFYWPTIFRDAARTAYKSPIGSTPFRIVYGKACHLSMEMEHKAYWALKNINLDLDTARKHRYLQLNKLAKLKNEAYEHSRAYKERTKRWHDAKITAKEFHEGDEVLVFNSRLKLFLGKLKSRWYGPYTISKVFPYGTVEVCGKNGVYFKVNGHSSLYEEMEFEVSLTCGRKVLYRRNHKGETRLFYRYFARSQLLQLSFGEESNT
ncbi:reverse transcriptase domain-containing protein, partial [Tanacetum coccineum]